MCVPVPVVSCLAPVVHDCGCHRHPPFSVHPVLVVGQQRPRWAFCWSIAAPSTPTATATRPDAPCHCAPRRTAPWRPSLRGAAPRLPPTEVLRPRKCSQSRADVYINPLYCSARNISSTSNKTRSHEATSRSEPPHNLFLMKGEHKNHYCTS